MDINALIAIKPSKQIRYATSVKNKVMGDGLSVQDNFAENGSIKTVTNTYSRETISFPKTMNKIITVHSAEKSKSAEFY